jgi:hypothetical protein
MKTDDALPFISLSLEPYLHSHAILLRNLLIFYPISCLLLTYLPTYLLTYLLTNLLTYLLTYLLDYLLTYLLASLLHGVESILRNYPVFS